MRLSAPTDSLLSRGRTLLEDALRTATLPGEHGGRVLVVRSLKVGRIAGHASPASVALALEQSLYKLGARAVHAEDPSAAAAPAVYFNDDAEPFVCLAARLARQACASEWFWPLAVPGWQPSMGRDDALRHLLRETLRTRAGVIAAVTLVGDLHERGVVDQLLSALRWQDGPVLLNACGWGTSVPAPAPEAPPPSLLKIAAARSFVPLERWCDRWGADDARTRWLAAVTILADKAARLQDPRLTTRARQLIGLLALRKDERGGEKTGRKSAPPGAARQEVSPPQNPPRERRSIDDAAAAPPDASRPTRGHGESRAEEDSRAPRARGNLTAVSPTDASASAFTRPVDEESPAAAGGATQEEAEEGKGGRAPWSQVPLPTRYAGLLFLIPVLSRLGLRQVLEGDPRLIECNLPERLLHLVGRRLRIPIDDPMICWLDAAVREPAPHACEFLAPPAWRRGLCDSDALTIGRMEGAPGARILCDKTGRLPLGLWRGRPPAAVREFVGAARLRRCVVPPAEDIDLLLRSWLGAARRWCRRLARLGLSDLVCRGGRVCVTRTHLDVLFDHRQVDVRVRRVGLDLNPGWVAWLGRVVTFHYLDGEQPDED